MIDNDDYFMTLSEDRFDSMYNIFCTCDKKARVRVFLCVSVHCRNRFGWDENAAAVFLGIPLTYREEQLIATTCMTVNS